MGRGLKSFKLGANIYIQIKGGEGKTVGSRQEKAGSRQ